MQRLELDYLWEDVFNEMQLLYCFPASLSVEAKKQYIFPCVYRWLICKESEQKIVYIGETVNLSRRVHGYINPGSSQHTNKRMRGLLCEYIDSGYSVQIQYMKLNSLVIDGRIYISGDLINKSLRRLIENMLIVDHHSKDYLVLNSEV